LDHKKDQDLKRSFADLFPGVTLKRVWIKSGCQPGLGAMSD